MKKLFTLLLGLVLGIGVINAQNQRVVVLECFTSSTCGPCASANPGLDNLINSNPDNLVAIKYHVNWPSPGNDPMYLANPTDASSKVSFYSINTVPHSVGDGTWKGNSSSVSQSLINQWAAVGSPVEMRMTYYINDTQDTINVIVMGRALAEVNSNNLKLNVGIIEKTIEYTSAPGTNDERVFHNVMKKMLPNASGTSIAPMQAGDYFAYKFSWALANVMDVNELTAIAWLQDSNTKQMFQGCKSSETIEPYFAKYATVSKIEHMKRYVCSGSVTPDITIDNLGSETINSMIINVYCNNNLIAQIPWEGNMEFGKSRKINLGELNFDVEAHNTITYEVSQINGAPNEYPGSISYSFDEAPSVAHKSFKLSIRTDNNPEAITWEIINTGNGEIVLSGGPYEEIHHMYNQEFDLDETGCYMFTIYDAMGDGLSSGIGLYGLKAGSTTLFSGGDFTDRESNEFSYTKGLNVQENQVNTASIYPNPSNGIVIVDTQSKGVVNVYNITGQLIYNHDVDGETTVDISNLEKGAYLFVVTDENGNSSKQIIVLQ